MFAKNEIQLIATVTPEICPDIDVPVRIVNKKVVSVRGGSLVFYVLTTGVLVVKRIRVIEDFMNTKELPHMPVNTHVSQLYVPVEVKWSD